MISNGRRRGIGAAAIGMAALAVGAGLLGGGTAHGATAASDTAGAASARASVPWKSVGTGWALDTYSLGTMTHHEPTTLYLISPAGPKFPLFAWKASATPAPSLVAWAGNKTEALFQLYSANGAQNGVGELNLLTGKMTRVAFSTPNTSALGYTLPTGTQVLGSTQNGTVARYTQAGALVKKLVSEKNAFSGLPLDASYSPNGTQLGVTAPGGLLLVSNAGGVIRKLPVLGADTRLGCNPVRWWNSTTLLASCTPKTIYAQQLWLVPASGARPAALTPVRNPAKAPNDFGDIDGWQLPSGLYLQSLGACGTLELNKQAHNGSISRVPVWGMNNSPVVVIADGSWLLVEQLGCDGDGGQLAWFNPATHAERWLFTYHAGAAVAYNSNENGDIR